MLKKLRTSLTGKKGFTLVELVVVLVILAILATLLMPSLTGYIDKAKDKRVVAEVHQVVMAAQALADEAYAKEDSAAGLTNATYAAVTLDAVEDLSETKATLESIYVEIESGKVVYAMISLGGETGYYGETAGIGSSLDDTYELPAVPEEGDDYVVLSGSSTG